MKRMDPLLGLVEDFPPRTGTARLLSSQAVPVPLSSLADAPFCVGSREPQRSRLGYEPCAPFALVPRVYPAAAAKTGRNGVPRVLKDARTQGSAVTLGTPPYGDAA